MVVVLPCSALHILDQHIDRGVAVGVGVQLSRHPIATIPFPQQDCGHIVTVVVHLFHILVMSDPRLRKMMDIKVFVDADGDDRLIRVISRDCIERGRTAQEVIDRYQSVLKPMHLMHIEPCKRYVDIIVPEGGHNEVAINLLTDYIKTRLNLKK